MKTTMHYIHEVPRDAVAAKDLVDTALSCSSDQTRSAALLSLLTGLKRQPRLAKDVVEHVEALYFNIR